MKALSLIQPWATLVAIGAKRIETRAWATDYRGPLAIHASKWLTSRGCAINADVAAYLALCFEEPFRTALTQGGIEHVRELPSGAIVATARLVDVRSTDAFDVDDYERAFGDYRPRRFAWLLADVVALPAPIAHRGFPGLWDFDDALFARSSSEASLL